MFKIKICKCIKSGRIMNIENLTKGWACAWEFIRYIDVKSSEICFKIIQ